MNGKHKNNQYIILSVVALFILACGMGSFASGTQTPSATFTPLVTNTATAKPTATSRPTSTPRPTATPFPTSAPLGVSIDAGDYSYSVVDAVSLLRFYPGGEFLFNANPGYMIVDVGIRLQNNNPGEAVSIPWEEVYITEANGDSWYAYYGSVKAVEAGLEMDPFTIGISNIELDVAKKIEFTGDAYLRIIFLVDDNDNKPVPLIFGIGPAPDAQFIVEQPK